MDHHTALRSRRAPSRHAPAPATGGPHAAALALQRSAGNRAVAKLARKEADDALSAEELAQAVKHNKGLAGNQAGVLAQARAHLNLVAHAYLKVANESDEALAQAVAGYQRGKGEKASGKLTKDTIASMRSEGMGSKDWGKRLDAAERKELDYVKAIVGWARGNTQTPKRDLIVATARSQVGTVNALNRGDGGKYGGERVAEYFSVVDTRDKETKKLGEAQWNPDEKAKMRATNAKPGDWCGIFATWAVQTATGRGRWEAGKGPHDLPKHSDDKFVPGDILKVKDPPDNPNLNHHVVFAGDLGGQRILCIEGNTLSQQIIEKERPRSDVQHYYRAVENDASNP